MNNDAKAEHKLKEEERLLRIILPHGETVSETVPETAKDTMKWENIREI